MMTPHLLLLACSAIAATAGALPQRSRTLEASAGGWFETHAAAVTKAVQQKYPPPSPAVGKFLLMEADLCPSDPAVDPQPGGCMGQKPVSKLEDMGWIHLVYSPANDTAPNVEVKLNTASGAMTFTVHEDPYMGDIMHRLPVGDEGVTTMQEALDGVNKLATNFTGTFNTVNYRFPLTLCVTEHIYFFTDSVSPTTGQIGFVAVGAESGRVCQTTVTEPDPIIPLCNSRPPQCWN
jgi:hypothetical protein